MEWSSITSGVSFGSNSFRYVVTHSIPRDKEAKKSESAVY